MSESLAWYAAGVVFAALLVALWLPAGVKLLAGGERRYAALMVVLALVAVGALVVLGGLAGAEVRSAFDAIVPAWQARSRRGRRAGEARQERRAAPAGVARPVAIRVATARDAKGLPRRAVRRRSMVERGWPRIARARFEEAW